MNVMNVSSDHVETVPAAGPSRRAWWRRVKLPRRSITLWTIRFWRQRLTRSGRYATIGSVTTAIAATLPEQMVGSFAFSFFASLTVVSLGISLIRRPGVMVDRQAPQRVMKDQPAQIAIRISNPSARAAADVGAYEFGVDSSLGMGSSPRYIDRLDPGGSHTFHFEIRPRTRGHFILPGPTALSAFPFGLTNAMRFTAQQQSVVVYPSFHPIQKMAIEPVVSYQPGGVALASHLGDTMEFIGTRPYRPGDRLRDLHPRSWARVGEPVVRQFEDEFMVRVAMVVDTFVPRRVGVRWQGMRRLPEMVTGTDERLLEANLSLAAGVAEYLARQEYVVDLFAAGPELYHFQSGRSLAYLDNILDILASIEGCRENPFEVIGPSFAQQLRQTSSVIVLLMGWDKGRSEFVETIRGAGVPLRLIVVTDDGKQGALAVEAGALHLTTRDVERGPEVL
jgi:uncharacterized protein (DUF58 family)